VALFGELNRLVEIRITFLNATHCEELLMIDKYRATRKKAAHQVC